MITVLNVDQVKKLVDIKEIGTYATRYGRVKMWYERGKVVVEHYREVDDFTYRLVYDTLDEAETATAQIYY